MAVSNGWKTAVLVLFGGAGLCAAIAGEFGLVLNEEKPKPQQAAERWKSLSAPAGESIDEEKPLASAVTHGPAPASEKSEQRVVTELQSATESLAAKAPGADSLLSILSSRDAPPLAAAGPASNPAAFFRLKDFEFPSEASLLGMIPITNDAKFERAFAELKQSLVGSSAERARVSKKCKQTLDQLEAAGRLKGKPEPETFGCSYHRLQRLAKELEELAAKREQEEQDRLEAERDDVVQKRPGNFPRVIRNQQDWIKLAGRSYRQSVGRFRLAGKKDAMRVADLAAVDVDACTTAGARSGLLRSLEDLLPDENVFESMIKLYELQRKCLRPNDDSFEEIHLRMGLLFLERSRLAEAGTSFNFALLDREGRDAYRVLFWRGLLEALKLPRLPPSQGGIVALNSYWQKLLSTYPLSFHALVADSITGHTLHNRLLQQGSPWVGLYSGTEWDAHNYASLLFALMIARKEDRMMQVFGKYVIRALEPVSFEQGMFIGLAQQKADFTRGAIQSMFLAVSRYGTAAVNLEVLDRLYPRYYVKELEKYGNDVDLALALSLMRQESSFNPQAASAARARGLMQVLPGTARMMMRRKNINLFDPVQNIQAGTLYLKHLLARYENNYVQTIAAYNAGPGKVVKWKTRYLTEDPLLFADLIPYRETRNYVSGLLRNIHWYRVLLNGDKHQELISSSDSSTWTARSLVPDPSQWGIKNLHTPVDLSFDNAPNFQAVQ